MFKLKQIIGKRVFAIKGKKNIKFITPIYILFDDGETYIELNEQDCFSFHDCSFVARNIDIYTNNDMWHSIITSSDYMNANVDI